LNCLREDSIPDPRPVEGSPGPTTIPATATQTWWPKYCGARGAVRDGVRYELHVGLLCRLNPVFGAAKSPRKSEPIPAESALAIRTINQNFHFGTQGASSIHLIAFLQPFRASLFSPPGGSVPTGRLKNRHSAPAMHRNLAMAAVRQLAKRHLPVPPPFFSKILICPPPSSTPSPAPYRGRGSGQFGRMVRTI